MRNSNSISGHPLHVRKNKLIKTGVPHAVHCSLFFHFILILSIFLLLFTGSHDVVGTREGDTGELVIDLSTTNITFDKSIYVNLTLTVENNTGDVTVLVKDPNNSTILMETSELIDGNASIEFSLFKWYPNGSYSVFATARTPDNQTYHAISRSFEFVNWTSPPPIRLDEDDDTLFPLPPAPLIFVTGMATVAVLLGYSTDKGKYGLWMLIIPLYSRLKKSEALEDFNRGQIYRTISEHPGIRYSEIRKKVGIGNGVLTYHLKVLQSMRYVKAVGDKTLKRFYLWGTAETLPPDLDKPFTPIQRSLVDYLSSNNWSTQKNMATALRIKQQTLSKNLKKLEQADIVKRVKEVNVYRYNLTDGYVNWLNRQISPKCPTCLNVCRIGARFCENCGTKLANS